MSKINQNNIDDIKEILLNDTIALMEIAGELNILNNCLPTLSYHDLDEESFGVYVLDYNNQMVECDDLLNMCKEKIDDIIQAMLQYYKYIDVNCSEIEDYMLENNLT